MFDVKKWVKEGVINGFKRHEYSKPQVVLMTAGYIAKGVLTAEDAEEIDAACVENIAEEVQTNEPD